MVQSWDMAAKSSELSDFSVCTTWWVQDKRYYRHTGYPGGIRSTSAEQMLKASPEDIIRKAVTGMLPKNAFGRQLIKKLKVYPDADHRHSAQNPVPHS